MRSSGGQADHRCGFSVLGCASKAIYFSFLFLFVVVVVVVLLFCCFCLFVAIYVHVLLETRVNNHCF